MCNHSVRFLRFSCLEQRNNQIKTKQTDGQKYNKKKKKKTVLWNKFVGPLLYFIVQLSIRLAICLLYISVCQSYSIFGYLKCLFLEKSGGALLDWRKWLSLVKAPGAMFLLILRVATGKYMYRQGFDWLYIRK